MTRNNFTPSPDKGNLKTDRSALIDTYTQALQELTLSVQQLESTLEAAKDHPIPTSAAQDVIVAIMDAKITDALGWQMPEVTDLYSVLTWGVSK